MKIYNPNMPLLSIHIPKCAGVSFRYVLKKWFDQGLKYHYMNEKKGKRPKIYNLHSRSFFTRKIRPICIHGHFPNSRGLGMKDSYPEVDQYITVLRDPFDMIVSNYRYMMTLKNKAYRDGRKIMNWVDSEFTLEKYLETAAPYTMLFFPKETNLRNYKAIIEENYVYIGIAEDLQRSIDCLALRLGFNTIEAPKLNISKHYEEIPSDAREKFIESYPLDYAIYKFANDNYLSIDQA